MEGKLNIFEEESFQLNVPIQLYPKRRAIESTKGILHDILSEYDEVSVPISIDANIAQYKREVLYYITMVGIYGADSEVVESGQVIDPYAYFLVHQYFGAPEYYHQINIDIFEKTNPSFAYMLRLMRREEVVQVKSKVIDPKGKEHKESKETNWITYTEQDIDKIKWLAFNKVYTKEEEKKIENELKLEGSTYSEKVAQLEEFSPKGQFKTIDIPVDVYPTLGRIKEIENSYLKTVLEKNPVPIEFVTISIPIKFQHCVNEILIYISALSLLLDEFEAKPVDMKCLYQIHAYFDNKTAIGAIFDGFIESGNEAYNEKTQELQLVATFSYLLNHNSSWYIVNNDIKHVDDVFNAMRKDEELGTNDYVEMIKFIDKIRTSPVEKKVEEKKEDVDYLSGKPFIKPEVIKDPNALKDYHKIHELLDSDVLKQFIIDLLQRDIDHTEIWEALYGSKLRDDIPQIFTDIKVGLLTEGKNNTLPFRFITTDYSSHDKKGYDAVLNAAMLHKPNIASYIIATLVEDGLNEESTIEAYRFYMHTLINNMRIEDGLAPIPYIGIVDEIKVVKLSKARPLSPDLMRTIAKMTEILENIEKELLIESEFTYDQVAQVSNSKALVARSPYRAKRLGSRFRVSPSISISTNEEGWENALRDFVNMLSSPEFRSISFTVVDREGMSKLTTTHEIVENIKKSMPEVFEK